ncbi:hypothetical protein FIV06_07820 [Labrenzia sp. THAF191b]|nr:hypothetical protein FIV06_07800 [Labrenzia sp. THAF191b]QFT03634.1 hypothetical protein FIV05_07800 [Labrenzia sp. THAF191a]QFT15176.1 hypothetical protein FIV03_07805 [Labrenzia sp. THAF187b]QFS97323.1 hypothetical protein FIV06_07820 [Labrenzia sp. THAF191b]QFT03638.1 hypothetical protein FIV05_07820 [Labrenzia sp. THAF191a]
MGESASTTNNGRPLRRVALRTFWWEGEEADDPTAFPYGSLYGELPVATCLRVYCWIVIHLLPPIKLKA